MRAKIFISALIFLFLFSCKDENVNPYSPESPKIGFPQIIYFTATPNEILYGNSSILSWSVRNVLKVEINNGIGEVLFEDSVDIQPNETITYKLTATNKDSVKTKTILVEIKDGGNVIFTDGPHYEVYYSKNAWGTEHSWISFEGKYKNIGNMDSAAYFKVTGWYSLWLDIPLFQCDFNLRGVMAGHEKSFHGTDSWPGRTGDIYMGFSSFCYECIKSGQVRFVFELNGIIFTSQNNY